MSPHLPASRTILMTTAAMVAFAANSILCRLALAQGAIDPGSFTILRIGSGAAMLWLLLALSGRARVLRGSWTAALALFVYAAAFSFAYVTLAAAAGALLLFGAVQATMVTAGLARGERLAGGQWVGLALAIGGVAALLAPGASAPPLGGALLMLAAGVAWGAYSLLGRGSGDPLAATAGNFLRASPFAAVLWAATSHFGVQIGAHLGAHAEPAGLIYAVLSGGVASGLGYAIWYAALPGLSSVQGASVQLSVPVITALLGAVTLGESISLRLTLSSIAVLGGIALVISRRAQKR